MFSVIVICVVIIAIVNKSGIQSEPTYQLWLFDPQKCMLNRGSVVSFTGPKAVLLYFLCVTSLLSCASI
jgi:hypothetical protein